MIDRLLRSTFTFAAGAALGAVGALWLMSDSGKEARGELRDLASKAKKNLDDCYSQLKQQMEEDHGEDHSDRV